MSQGETDARPSDARLSRIPAWNDLRPNVLHDPSPVAPEETLERWFDTSAFSLTGLGETEPGNAGRNLVRGPSFHNLDFSLFKELPLKPLGEEAELQLRFEFFNLTNTPNFDRPNTDLSRGDFGSITRTVANPPNYSVRIEGHFLIWGTLFPCTS